MDDHVKVDPRLLEQASVASQTYDSGEGGICLGRRNTNKGLASGLARHLGTKCRSQNTSVLTGEEDREKVVENALQEMIQRRSKLQGLFDLVGKIEFYEGYDYKALRKTRYDAP